ncbi:guanyl-nucleotide exchange factor Sec73 [Schizosaccharomyces japonicus yFS275]|uniref:Guanyl-nucleotide exchange factor Sec73 n=1 Tax=Schizosaccharomyces japonicus (strain yFS275 / FY16936) TaxID=402676 RepID=B6K3Q5_SCHJY|nr:guanyl-nucleotide exchange factor Sec73 [Schizosaccharomyces japonicus yFS275]EEB08112.1 guanyl-nucleotide exchange factor Sec73 [Schizosaccharomyces japonicus yFS275]
MSILSMENSTLDVNTADVKPYSSRPSPSRTMTILRKGFARSFSRSSTSSERPAKPEKPEKQEKPKKEKTSFAHRHFRRSKRKEHRLESNSPLTAPALTIDEVDEKSTNVDPKDDFVPTCATAQNAKLHLAQARSCSPQKMHNSEACCRLSGSLNSRDAKPVPPAASPTIPSSLSFQSIRNLKRLTLRSRKPSYNSLRSVETTSESNSMLSVATYTQGVDDVSPSSEHKHCCCDESQDTLIVQSPASTMSYAPFSSRNSRLSDSDSLHKRSADYPRSSSHMSFTKPASNHSSSASPEPSQNTPTSATQSKPWKKRRNRARSSTIPSQRSLEKLRDNRISIFSFRSLRKEGEECLNHALEESGLLYDINSYPTRGSEGSIDAPKPLDDETAESYLERVRKSVPPCHISSALAQKDYALYRQALDLQMKEFNFTDMPIDICLRQFLLKAHLPKETQQIDRVITAISERFFECNPDMFSSPDKCYILVFSLIMLHTDAFNVNNKHKMTKPEFVQLCKMDGLMNEVMEYFYDNITYTPFVNLEDELLSEREKSESRQSPLQASLKKSRFALYPYMFILENKMDLLRSGLSLYPFKHTYYCYKSDPQLELEFIRNKIANPAILQIVSERSHPMAFSGHFRGLPDNADPGMVDIHVASLDTLLYSDRKRKSFSTSFLKEGLVILTTSQLYLFRNMRWARKLQAQVKKYESNKSKTKPPNKQRFYRFITNHSDSTLSINSTHAPLKTDEVAPLVFKPPVSNFNPDSAISLINAFAYTRSDNSELPRNSFIVLLRDGSEEVFVARSKEEMFDWINRINYIATLRTAGIRVPVKGDRSWGTNRYEYLTNPQDAAELVAMEQQMYRDVEFAHIRSIKERIGQIKSSLQDRKTSLLSHKRNAIHLSFCTPLQSKTRALVQEAGKKLQESVRADHFEILKLQCQLNILRCELQHAADRLDDLSLPSDCSIHDAEDEANFTTFFEDQPYPRNSSSSATSSARNSRSEERRGKLQSVNTLSEADLMKQEEQANGDSAMPSTSTLAPVSSECSVNTVVQTRPKKLHLEIRSRSSISSSSGCSLNDNSNLVATHVECWHPDYDASRTMPYRRSRTAELRSKRDSLFVRDRKGTEEWVQPPSDVESQWHSAAEESELEEANGGRS